MKHLKSAICLARPLKTFLFLASLTSMSVPLFSGCATSPTGRKQVMIVPEAQMDALGVQSFDQLKATTPADSNSQDNSYVACIANAITENAKEQTSISKWEVVVFHDPQVNAFALPGGKIGVYEGLLKVATTPAQLAAVIGHEVGHVIAKHGAERVSQSLIAQGGLAALGAFTKNAGTTGQLASLLGAGVAQYEILSFSRDQESEADVIGLDLMSRSGFDPRQSIDLWHNMEKASGGQKPPEFLSTHPTDEHRIATLQSHMSDAISTYSQAQGSGRVPSCAR